MDANEQRALNIKYSALKRLVKDLEAYKAEYKQEQARLAKLESNTSGGLDKDTTGSDSDDNNEFQIKQQSKIVDQCQKMVKIR